VAWADFGRSDELFGLVPWTPVLPMNVDEPVGVVKDGAPVSRA